jgi:DnaJ like chaperone protein
MDSPLLSEFEQLFLRSQNQLGISVLLVLAWVASSDDHLDERELSRLRSIAQSSKHDSEIDSLVRIARLQDADALLLASEVLQSSFDNERAELFLRMAIGVAIADGTLAPTENHILRFLSDLLRLSPQSLNEAFLEMTGKPIVEPSDVSSEKFWNTGPNSDRNRKQNTQDARTEKNQLDLEHLRALAILGLDEGATKDEVKQAFRRMSQVHHPDRFAKLGEEAVAAATVSFRRIKQAYDFLNQDA